MKRKLLHSILIALSSLVASLLYAQPEEAMTPTDYILPDFVVTSDLWDTNLADSTQSATVLDSTELKASSAQHFKDIANSIPNLTWTGGTSRPRHFQIRGVGENSQFEGETPDSSVRFLIDDIDFTGLGTVGSLFDVQQVEVLRGPQAGAYGVNAAGGIIKIVTKEPTPYWTGNTEVTLGQDALRSTALAIGGPLLSSDPEKLSFRLALQESNSHGFRKNQFLEKNNTNALDEFNSRLKIKWILSEDFQVNATLLYSDIQNGYDEWSLNNTGFDVYSDNPGQDLQESSAASIRTEYEGFDTFKLTTISSITETDTTFSYDADWGAGYVAAPNASGFIGFLKTDREREVFSQEIKLDSKETEDALGWIDRWTIGAHYQRLEEDTLNDYDDDYGTIDALSLYENESTALFSKISHNFSDSQRATLGLRVEDHKVMTSSNGTDSGDYVGQIIEGDSKASNTLYGAKFTFEQDINENHSAHASISRGYKGGGSNISAFNSTFDPKTYKNETILNYEIGLSSQWIPNKFHTKITVFQMDRSNAQLRDSKGAGGFFRYLTVNGNDASHVGLEAELFYKINANWQINSGIGLLETDREAYTVRDGLNSDGSIRTVTILSRDLANAPKINAFVTVNYQSEDGLFFNAGINARDSHYESNSHFKRRGAMTVLNSTIGYQKNNWTYSLWAKNLLDNDYAKRIFYFDNYHPEDGYVPTDRLYKTPADPQQFGVSVNYAW